MRVGNFFQELKRRNVYKVAITYAIVAWLIVQIGSIVPPTINAPEWVMQTLLFFVVIGFPIALILAWAFETSPQGIIRISSIAAEKNPFPASKKKPPEKKSIIVLPFVNISPDPAQEYFIDGLTEEIISDLSHIRNLLVISRKSAMSFKATKMKTIEIAREVNVRYVLEGSVRKAGNDLRITAQLLDALSDSHLWAEKYSGTLDDVFDIQEQVSRSIVEALKIKLNQKELQKLEENPITNPKAYELYQKAQFEVYRFKEDALNRALQYLSSALKVEGENAFLYSKIGIVYCILLSMSNKPVDSYFKKARHFAAKVFDLEPDSYRGHVILGWITFYDGNIMDAVTKVREAFRSNHNDPDILVLLILGYSYLGLSKEAERFAVKMGEVDPFNPVYYALLSFFYYMKGDLNKAFEQIKMGYEIYPEIPQIQLYYVYFLAIQQNFKEANQILKRYISGTSGSIFSTVGVLFQCALNGMNPDHIITDEIEDKLKMDCEWSWLATDFYSMMGKKEVALNWLEHTINRGFINYPLLSQYDPFLNNIRKEERFLKLMEKVKHSWEYLDEKKMVK